MDGQRFDTLARTIARPRSRRTVLRAVAGVALAALGVPLAGSDAVARVCRGGGDTCDPTGGLPCCDGACCGAVCCAAGEVCSGGRCVPADKPAGDCGGGCDPFVCQACSEEGTCVSTCRVNEICVGGGCAPVCPPCEWFDPIGQTCVWTCDRGAACIDGACAACCSGGGWCDFRGVGSGLFTADDLCCVYPDESYAMCFAESSPGAGDGGGWVGCCGGTVPCPGIPPGRDGGIATGGVPDPSPGAVACPSGRHVR